MTAIINNPVTPVPPVVCDFWWKPNGPNLIFTANEDSYLWPQSVPKVEIRFYATKAALEAESALYANNPHIVLPSGVTITTFIWDFGDGTIISGKGTSFETVKHTYKVADPNTSVKLTVVDSRNLRWSCLKPLNLVNSLYEPYILNPYKIRETTFVKAKPKLTEKALSKDSASVTGFHFKTAIVSLIEKALTKTKPIRVVKGRHTGPITSTSSITADTPVRVTQLHSMPTTTESATTDSVTYEASNENEYDLPMFGGSPFGSSGP